MRRGFTLIEMAVCLSVTSIVVPLVFLVSRAIEGESLRALADVEAAEQMRAVSEELRRDLQSMRVAEGRGLVLEGSGPCGRIEYAIASESVLVRRESSLEAGAPAACGERPVARSGVRGAP